MAFDADDISQFFDEDMPGYAVATFETNSVPGIFSDGYVPAMGIVESSQPEFNCPAEMVDGLLNGDDLPIQHGETTETFVVINQQPDGNGFTTLILERKDA